MPVDHVVIASGPSLTRADVDTCCGKAKVFVVNDGYRIAPWADVMYAADHDWWLAPSPGVGTPNHAHSRWLFHGERWTCDPGSAEQFGLFLAEHQIDPWKGVWGQNSGVEAITLAVLRGAKRIALLGFDMGGSHWFGDHAPPLRNTPNEKFEDFIDEIETKLAPWLSEANVEVINCSRATALRCFPRAAIEEVL